MKNVKRSEIDGRKVVLFWDECAFVAQTIDDDCCTQGNTELEAMESLNRILIAWKFLENLEKCYPNSNKLSDMKAPKKFKKMYEEAVEEFNFEPSVKFEELKFVQPQK